MLVRMRLRLAMKRHAQHFYRSISDRPEFGREADVQSLSVRGGDDVYGCVDGGVAKELEGAEGAFGCRFSVFVYAEFAGDFGTGEPDE